MNEKLLRALLEISESLGEIDYSGFDNIRNCQFCEANIKADGWLNLPQHNEGCAFHLVALAAIGEEEKEGGE